MNTPISDKALRILHGRDACELRPAVLNERDELGRNLTDCLILLATNPLGAVGENPLPIIRKLLEAGADVTQSLDHIVNLHELYFEATAQNSREYRQAVDNATDIIPALLSAGAVISQSALDSAKYNCDPRIQTLLATVPVRG